MHIDELAELYALGALDAAERAQVSEHIAHCAACLRRVGEAEETVLALEGVVRPVTPSVAVPMQRRSAALWWPAAVAAALIVGLLLPRPFATPQNPALLAMIHSHFSHAQFSGAPGTPAAKVIYARDRSWLYVIVEGTNRYHVYGVGERQAVFLGATEPHGETSYFYGMPEQRFQRIELRDAGRIIETAALR